MIYKSLKITAQDIHQLRIAKHILLQARFEQKKRPRGKITCIFDDDGVTPYHALTAGSDLIYLTRRLYEPYVECHYLIEESSYNPIWTTFAGILLPKDELEIVWLPDCNTIPELLGTGLFADAIKMICHRGEKQFHFLLNAPVSTGEHRPIRRLTIPVLKSELLTTP